MFDMKQCKPGDKLISTHDVIPTYVGPNKHDMSDLYPHEVKYPNDVARMAFTSRKPGSPTASK
jgi:hypothetical protein